MSENGTLEMFKSYAIKDFDDKNIPYSLAMQAKMEIRNTGMTRVKCPKCNTSPIIRVTEKGERTIVTCRCGYIHSVDINF